MTDSDPTPREKLISLHDRATDSALQSIFSTLTLTEEIHNLIGYAFGVHSVSMLRLADRENFAFQKPPDSIVGFNLDLSTLAAYHIEQAIKSYMHSAVLDGDVCQELEYARDALDDYQR